MKMIPIVPTEYLSSIESRDTFMCLAHLIDVDMKYTEFYARKVREGCYVIMDNGACEGDLRPLKELIDKVKKYGFQELIIPDSFDNAVQTRNYFFKHYMKLRRALPNTKLMAVTHGDIMHEHARNIAIYVRDGVDVIGIPKVVSEHLGPKGRVRLAYMIHEIDSNVKIHFLGAGMGYSEIPLIPESLGIRSIDSALPFILAKEDKHMLQERCATITFKEELGEVNDDLLQANLQIWS